MRSALSRRPQVYGIYSCVLQYVLWILPWLQLFLEYQMQQQNYFAPSIYTPLSV